jgi:tetratricopeptide (TPR) repeat protein
MRKIAAVLLLGEMVCLRSLRPVAADEEARKALQQGLGAFRAAQFDAAVNFFSAALALDPSLLSAHFWRGRTYAEKQAWKEAEQDFRHVLEAKPESVESLYWLGHVLEAQDRRREALACYEKALRLDPRHREAAAGCERLECLRILLSWYRKPAPPQGGKAPREQLRKRPLLPWPGKIGRRACRAWRWARRMWWTAGPAGMDRRMPAPRS